MGFLGLVPSDKSSGEKIKHGSITKAGNSHVRRMLVEAAWAYRFRARVSRALLKRQRICRNPFATLPGKPNCGYVRATDTFGPRAKSSRSS